LVAEGWGSENVGRSCRGSCYKTWPRTPKSAGKGLGDLDLWRDRTLGRSLSGRTTKLEIQILFTLFQGNTKDQHHQICLRSSLHGLFSFSRPSLVNSESGTIFSLAVIFALSNCHASKKVILLQQLRVLHETWQWSCTLIYIHKIFGLEDCPKQSPAAYTLPVASCSAVGLRLAGWQSLKMQAFSRFWWRDQGVADAATGRSRFCIRHEDIHGKFMKDGDVLVLAVRTAI
jgi:hypothetical protein